MSNRSGFTGGFLAGAILGGAIGGAIGAILTNRQNRRAAAPNDSLLELSDEGDRRSLAGADNMESARRNLEDKIAQLNDTIDDVREQLHVVNGSASSNDDLA